MLIPTVLALSEFFSKNFPDSFSWYPYWYLGNPYHYLIGPVVPTVLWVVRGFGEVGGIRIPLEGAYLLFILGSLVLGGFGIFLLLRDWGVGKVQAAASGIVYVGFPAGFFLLFYQNGLNHIAFGLLPFVLLLFRKFLVKENKFLVVFLAFTITVMLLTNVSILLPVIIGFIALFVSREDNLGSRHSGNPSADGASRISHSGGRCWTSQHDESSVEDKIGKIILLIILSLLLSTLWYTPKFWWVITTNPSLGGVPLGKLAWSIFQFLLQFLPTFLAIAVVKFRKYKFQGHLLFGLLFFTSFLFLSIVRFISDPDFVVDWISFGLELQFGGAIILGHVFLSSRTRFGISKRLLRSPMGIGVLAMTAIIIFISIIFNLIVMRSLVKSFNSLYQERIIAMLKKNVKENGRVFLSGSSVFFINSKLNIQQVRGGVDQSSIHPFWAHGAYQIREGTSAGLAYDWLRALGVSYILVHNKDSEEPFGDFKHPEKFSTPSGSVILACPESPSVTIKREILESQAKPDPQNDDCENHGDRLYRVSGALIGRVADASILDVQKPKNGADKQAINKYIVSFKRPLAVNYQKPNEIAISGNIKQGEVVSLAISYDSLWHIVYGKGMVTRDPLGNMAIIPKQTGMQRFEIVHKRSLHDILIPLLLSIIILVTIAKFDKIASYIKKRLPKLSIGLHDEDY